MCAFERSEKGMKFIMDKEYVYSKELRNPNHLKEVPKDMPGWYRWWAPEEALKMLLDSPYLNNKYLSSLLSHLTIKNINGKNYYYIYVGVATKRSIQSRLNWHINQHHTKSSVESGFLSTLRKSISSLVAFNQYDEDATNNFINMLIVEYHSVNLPIKSNEAKEKIEGIEKNEIDNNVLILNIKENKNVLLKDYLKELKKIRKNSK